jgi:hypothetical protein
MGVGGSDVDEFLVASMIAGIIEEIKILIKGLYQPLFLVLNPKRAMFNG